MVQRNPALDVTDLGISVDEWLQRNAAMSTEALGAVLVFECEWRAFGKLPAPGSDELRRLVHMSRETWPEEWESMAGYMPCGYWETWAREHP